MQKQFAHHDTRKTTVTARILVIHDDCPDASYLEQDDFSDRLEQYRRGDFSFVGVRLEVERHDWKSGVNSCFQSAGCWGIETDSGEEYYREIAGEELAEMRKELSACGIDLDTIDTATAPIHYS